MTWGGGEEGRSVLRVECRDIGDDRRGGGGARGDSVLRVECRDLGDDLGGRVAVVPHTAEVAGVAGRQDLDLHLSAPVLVLAPAVVIARRLGGTPADSQSW